MISSQSVKVLDFPIEKIKSKIKKVKFSTRAYFVLKIALIMIERENKVLKIPLN